MTGCRQTGHPYVLNRRIRPCGDRRDERRGTVRADDDWRRGVDRRARDLGVLRGWLWIRPVVSLNSTTPCSPKDRSCWASTRLAGYLRGRSTEAVDDARLFRH